MYHVNLPPGDYHRRQNSLQLKRTKAKIISALVQDSLWFKNLF